MGCHDTLSRNCLFERTDSFRDTRAFKGKTQENDMFYRSGTVNSKSFVGKVLLQIKRKFELTYAL